MPDLFHVALLAANTVILCAVAVLWRRARYHASIACSAANRARADRADAKRFAESASFAAYDAATDPTDGGEPDAPTILPFQTAPVFAPRLFVPGGPRDADEYSGA